MNSAHRKVVTVLFCDVVGSTALGESVDPEALQAILARYFERMKGIVESHGGTIDKFIGDAVMAVFGVPVAHEDDALRACRAALEMREALPGLGIQGRMGVNSGEVLTGTEERLVTGDPVNVAARFEQEAEPGEVLIGAETFALVAAAVEVAEERWLGLKGKKEPVAARPLLRIREATVRSHVSRFVGRERELRQLLDAWGRALAGPSCELVTVVGDAGVGKSRLVAEVLDRIDARIVRGRCLSYGEGVTYWPVVEVVKQLGAVPADEYAAHAIRSLLGESDASSGTDEIAWAFRKLLEEQAPLIVCFDDVQWGEETFLGLVESLSLLSTGVPLLLLCMARSELLDRRPGWPGTVRLEPLPTEEAAELVGDAVPDEARERIVHAAGGNPLFLTEMVALSEEGGGEVEVPPTLRALLAARLDQLDGGERRVLERGAVEGELFHRGTVQALAPEVKEVTPRLAALVRKELVRPDRPQLPREDAYRFRHLLIRDAAYDALPKAIRADLHRRFAAWLEEHGQSLVELDEVLGYHLEQAARYLEELGRPDSAVALAAGERLGVAGRRAFWRGDAAAARNLLERSLALTRPHRLDVHLEVTLVQALEATDVGRGVAVADDAVQRAAVEGDQAVVALARTAAAYSRIVGVQGSSERLERVARAAIPLLEAAEDDEGLAYLWDALADVAHMRCRHEDWLRASEQMRLHARRAGHPDSGHGLAAWPLILGPRPANEALAQLDAQSGEQPHPVALLGRAVLLAMLDRLEEAWALAFSAAERSRDFGYTWAESFLDNIADIAGDLEARQLYLRRACERLEASGRTSQLSTYAPRLGRVLCALGGYEEAETLAHKGRELGAPEDVVTQFEWRRVLALVLSARAEHSQAERLAREAVQFAFQTDSLMWQGHLLCDLAEVLQAATRPDEAAVALEQALDRYEEKGIVPLARRVSEQLVSIQPTQA
jgi:class 3 adenylate cyclase/tetratricopeptide (TPR) repeat protein